MLKVMKDVPVSELGICAVMWMLIGAAPAWAATYTVTNTNDSGPGSFRQALLDAAGNGSADAIVFDPSLNGRTLTLLSPLPAINEAISINGNGVTIRGNAGTGLVGGGANVTVQNMTIAGGAGTAGSAGIPGAAGLPGVPGDPLVMGSPGGPGGNGLVGLSGGAGGGGAAGFSGANVLLVNSASITGGAGGAGGVGGMGGPGGIGGPGNGGPAGPAGSQGPGGLGGTGGAGGAGVSGSNLTIINSGAITGGAGGIGGSGGIGSISGASGAGGAGGAGIEGDNLTITNSGTISGGLAGGSSLRGDAIHFTGGINTLTLQAGSVITGNVTSSGGATNAFALGGAAAGSIDLAAFDNQFGVFSSFAKQGSSTWTLTGTSFSTTDWTVSNGTLQIGGDGQFARVTGDVAVQSGGTVSGYQQINGDLTNGGIVAPGGPGASDIGTLTVSRNYTQAPGGTLRIIVTPGGASQLAVGGNATLGGTLNLAFAPGVYSATTRTIVTGTGGITGTFNTVAQNGGSAFGGVTYNLNTVLLGINNGTPGSGGSVTIAPSNGQVIGATSVSMVQGAQASNRALFGHLSDRRVGGSGDDNLRTAFAGSNPNQLAFAGDLAGLNAVLASLPEELAKQGGWFRAVGGFGSIDGSGGVPGVDSYGGGFMAGYDYQLTDHFLLGAAVGFSRTQLNQDDGSNSTINTPRVSLYGSYQIGAFALDGSVGYGYDRIKTNNASDGGVATSQHDAHEILAGLQASYAVDLPQQVVLTPRVGLDYLHLFEDGFKESGANGFDLTTKAGDMDSLRPSVGASVSRAFITDGGTTLTPQLDLTYSREVLDNGRNAQVLVGGGAFTVEGVKPSRDQLILGASLTASLTRSFDLFGGYTALLPIGNTISHNFEAGLRVTF